jgi:hypothetical protein
MIYRLNRMSYEFAQKLIKNHLIAIDRDHDWIDHKPSRTRRKAFFDAYGPVEYGKWRLGEEQDIAERSVKRFAFLFGDFIRIHRCALIAADLEVRKLDDIRDALARLQAQRDAIRATAGPRRLISFTALPAARSLTADGQ